MVVREMINTWRFEKTYDDDYDEGFTVERIAFSTVYKRISEEDHAAWEFEVLYIQAEYDIKNEKLYLTLNPIMDLKSPKVVCEILDTVIFNNIKDMRGVFDVFNNIKISDEIIGIDTVKFLITVDPTHTFIITNLHDSTESHSYVRVITVDNGDAIYMVSNSSFDCCDGTVDAAIINSPIKSFKKFKYEMLENLKDSEIII